MRNINVYAVDYKIDKATYEDGVTRNYHDALKEIRRIKKCIRPTEITLRVLTLRPIEAGKALASES